MTTDSQRNYIKGLLREAGISCTFVNADHADLPYMDSAYTSVDRWLDDLEKSQASKVIDYLKDQLGQ